MKQVFYLVVFLLIGTGICIAQTNGRKYSFLGILDTMPPIPENTVTASEAEKEAFKEKLQIPNEWLWDVENSLKDKEEIQFTPADFEKFEAFEREFETLYKPVEEFMTYIINKEMDFLDKRQIEEDALEELNAPYYEQLGQLGINSQNGENAQKRKQLLQKIYANKLPVNTNLAKINNEIIHEWSDGLRNLAPTIAKIEDFSQKFSNNGSLGVDMLRSYYKRLEIQTYFFNIGSIEESSTFDVHRYINKLFQ